MSERISFLRESLLQNRELSLQGDWKITLSLQNFKLFSIELTKRVLSCSDLFPIKGRTQISSFFEAFSTTSFFIKTLSKYFLI